jgi:hypothetical protein
MKSQVKVGEVSGLIVKMSDAESAVSNLRAEWIKLPAAEQGKELADFVKVAVAKSKLAMVVAMAYVATMPQRIEAEEVAEGYIKQAEAQRQKAMLSPEEKKHPNIAALEKAGLLKEKGADTDGRDSYRTTGEMRSRFGRVIRAVWGAKGNGANKLEGIGQEAVLQILTGPGSITDKLALLPSTRTTTTTTATQTEKRIAATLTAVPSMPALADALAIKPEKGSDKVQPKQVEDVLLGAIRVLPSERWFTTMQAMVNRGFNDSNPDVVDTAQNIKSVLIASVLSKEPSKAAKPKTTKPKTKQEKVTQ